MGQDLRQGPNQGLSQEVSQHLNQVRIVLLEPAGPLNVGSVARVMKNMGLSRLVLVNPQCDPLGEEARLMAVHAADVLEAAQQVATLADALQGCLRAVATTGRDRALPNTTLESPRVCLPWLITPGTTGSPPASALIFGREDRGLNNEELNYAQRFLRIPSHPAYPSLNLAQAVAVCCYELYEAVQQTGAHPESSAVDEPGQPFEPPATLDRVEGYYQHLETLLLQIGYLYPHTASSRMEKFRRLFNRASLTESEVAMLRGILTQMKWALQQAKLDDTNIHRP